MKKKRTRHECPWDNDYSVAALIEFCKDKGLDPKNVEVHAEKEYDYDSLGDNPDCHIVITLVWYVTTDK